VEKMDHRGEIVQSRRWQHQEEPLHLKSRIHAVLQYQYDVHISTRHLILQNTWVDCFQELPGLTYSAKTQKIAVVPEQCKFTVKQIIHATILVHRRSHRKMRTSAKRRQRRYMLEHNAQGEYPVE
jgi:hypothetical protein